MVKFPPPSRARRPRGIALVIVLCFVVLATGLIVAYFSRSITVRQLANSSTSATQADLLAQNAADVIAGDFKQEIVAGSTAVAPSPSPAAGTLYFPTQAGYMVPQRNLPTPTPAAGSSPAVGPMPNLIRHSLRNDAAAVPAPGLTSRASAAASDTPSANGRYVSATRWNQHGLLPTAAVSPSPAPFAAPDWVMVTAEHGPEVITGPTKDAAGTVTVVGRYAYAVYDEGGLLDANHAGFPSTSTFAQVGGKLSPGYADLTQLPSPSPATSLAPLTPAVVDNLLGWRNNATLAATGTFPTFTPLPGTAPSVYNSYLMASTYNPRQVPTAYANGRTDQMFLSRQQLISYFSAAGLDPSYLQYLTTFSRGLNQPSYAPELPPLYPPPLARPTPTPAAQGGNDSSGYPGINPSFLMARAASAFTRNDGTTAVVGEPLVKKRFALNRIAWLTYKGASANRSLTDPDMATLINTYNLSPSFLQQGTDANILAYFGLAYDYTNHWWVYKHGTNGANGSIVNLFNPNPTASTDVVRQVPGREADFFELLKAAVNSGSIAKSSLSHTSSIASPAYTSAALAQYLTDTSLDTAILQMGANIISQATVDNYPRAIGYDLGATGSYNTTFVYGVKNLPYISRVRSSLIRVKEAIPAENLYTNGSPHSTAAITDTGVGALMNLPEIWNPHDYGNTNTTAGLQQVMGVVGPRNFKIYATTPTFFPIAVCADRIGPASPNDWDANQGYNVSCDAVKAQSPGLFQSNSLFPNGSFGSTGSGKGGESRSLSQTNTLMTFSTPDDPTGNSAALFREPTILFQPNIPTGSLLASPVLANPSTANLGQIATNPSFFYHGGLLSAVQSAAGTEHPKTMTPYIGFYLGVHPLRWWDTYGTQTTPNNTDIAAGESVYGGPYQATYTLACEDGNGGWIPYDNKSISTIGDPDGYLNGTTTPYPFRRAWLWS